MAQTLYFRGFSCFCLYFYSGFTLIYAYLFFFCGQFLGLKKAFVDVFARDQVVFDGLAGDKAVFRWDGFAADEPFGGLWRDAENDSQHAVIHFFGEE